MKEYQCPVCGRIGEFWGKNTCDKCGAVVIRQPVVEDERVEKIPIHPDIGMAAIAQYIQDRLDALDADIALATFPCRAEILEGRKVELQWLQEYMRG